MAVFAPPHAPIIKRPATSDYVPRPGFDRRIVNGTATADMRECQLHRRAYDFDLPVFPRPSQGILTFWDCDGRNIPGLHDYQIADATCKARSPILSISEPLGQLSYRRGGTLLSNQSLFGEGLSTVFLPRVVLGLPSPDLEKGLEGFSSEIQAGCSLRKEPFNRSLSPVSGLCSEAPAEPGKLSDTTPLGKGSSTFSNCDEVSPVPSFFEHVGQLSYRRSDTLWSSQFSFEEKPSTAIPCRIAIGHHSPEPQEGTRGFRSELRASSSSPRKEPFTEYLSPVLGLSFRAPGKFSKPSEMSPLGHKIPAFSKSEPPSPVPSIFEPLEQLSSRRGGTLWSNHTPFDEGLPAAISPTLALGRPSPEPENGFRGLSSELRASVFSPRKDLFHECVSPVPGLSFEDPAEPRKLFNMTPLGRKTSPFSPDERRHLVDTGSPAHDEPSLHKQFDSQLLHAAWGDVFGTMLDSPRCFLRQDHTASDLLRGQSTSPNESSEHCRIFIVENGKEFV